MQMPGSLTRAAFDADPRQAAPNNVALKATNDFTQTRGALRLTWQPNPMCAGPPRSTEPTATAFTP